MGQKIRKTLLSLSCLISFSLLINAQVKDTKTKEVEAKAVNFVNKLGVYYGASLGANFIGNVAPFGNEYKPNFEKPMMNYYIGLTYGDIGLEYSYDTMSSTNVNNFVSNVSYHFIGLSNSSKNSFGCNNRWEDNHQLAVGYIRYNNKIDSWNNKDTYDISSNGFGLNYRYTIGYKTMFNTRNNGVIDAVSISLTLGTKLYTTFGWNGEERLLSNATYQGKFFGAKANFALIPYIGINVGLN